MVNKGYKQTEVGVIPEDWELLLLGKAAKVYRGGSPRPIQSYITNSPNGVNWIKIGDVRENDKYIYSTQEKISPDGIAMSREVHIGDFILSNSMSFGRPYILRTNGCIHDGWLTIQEYGHAFSTEYLYYLLSSKIIYKQYIGMAAGSSVKNLNKDKVSSLMVICPPLPEQQRIAEALSDVDGMISSLEKLIAKYKSIKTACLQQMFPQNGETVPRMRLPGFTGAWEQRKLSELAAIHARIGWQNLRTSEFLDSGDYMLITGTDFNDGAINFSTCHYVERARYEQDRDIQIHNGSILITKDGTLGKVAYVQGLSMPATLNAGVFNVQIKDANIVDEKYLFQYLKAPYLMDYVSKKATGGTIKHLNQNILVDFPVVMPKKSEQILIGAYFQQLDNLITFHQRKLEKVQKIKQGMMQQLLTGKIRLV